MGWLEDTSNEYKKLPTGGKIAVVGTLLLVAGVGFYEYRKNKGSTSGIGPSSPNTSLQPGQSSGLPSFPTGTTLLSDPNGNPIGTLQPPAPPVQNTPPPPGGTPAPGPGNPFVALFHDLSFLGGKPPTLGRVVNANGQVWTLVPGGSGRIWGVPGQVSSQTALNAPIQPGGKQLLFGGSGGGEVQSSAFSKQVKQHYIIQQNGHMHAEKVEVQ